MENAVEGRGFAWALQDAAVEVARFCEARRGRGTRRQGFAEHGCEAVWGAAVGRFRRNGV